MTKEEIKNVALELQRVSDEADEDFDVNYEGFQDNIEKALRYFLDAMLPGYTRRPETAAPGEDIRSHYLARGYECLKRACVQHEICDADALCTELVGRLPSVFDLLTEDMIAAYRGDPASKSVDEIILSYPAFLAIATFRIAHELYLLGQPMIARLMTEYAHRKTGIDIHPGATIGHGFFIDHGTGVVIGETTVIGNNVKLYQHVTLGAKSFDVEPDGSLVKGIKRHPNIGNNVVIYSGATILGGDVYIGDDCVIGGNVWLTRSVPAGQAVLANIPEPSIK